MAQGTRHKAGQRAWSEMDTFFSFGALVNSAQIKSELPPNPQILVRRLAPMFWLINSRRQAHDTWHLSHSTSRRTRAFMLLSLFLLLMSLWLLLVTVAWHMSPCDINVVLIGVVVVSVVVCHETPAHRNKCHHHSKPQSKSAFTGKRKGQSPKGSRDAV